MNKNKIAILAGLTACFSLGSAAMADLTWTGPGQLVGGAATENGGGGFTSGNDGSAGTIDNYDGSPGGFIFTDVTLEYQRDGADTALTLVTIEWEVQREFMVTGGTITGAITISDFGGTYNTSDTPLADFAGATLETYVWDVDGDSLLGSSVSSVSIAPGDLVKEQGHGFWYKWTGDSTSSTFSMADGTYLLKGKGTISFYTSDVDPYTFQLPSSAVSFIAVPAPGAALLVGFGLAAVGWVKRRIA